MLILYYIGMIIPYYHLKYHILRKKDQYAIKENEWSKAIHNTLDITFLGSIILPL